MRTVTYLRDLLAEQDCVVGMADDARMASGKIAQPGDSRIVRPEQTLIVPRTEFEQRASRQPIRPLLKFW